MKREARELAVTLKAREAHVEGRVEQLAGLQQEILALETELERLRSLQQAREKDRVALDHEMRKLGDELARAGSRLSVARLELDRLRRDAEKSAEQRDRNRTAVEEKERRRAESEAALEAERLELEKLEGEGATIGEEHAATRAALAALEERRRGEATAMGRLEQQWRETTERRASIAPEIERLGEERARLLADNIELDKRAQELAGQITALEVRVSEMARQDAGLREALRAGDEELKTLRLAVQLCQEKRSQVEVDLVRKQSELKFLDETSRKELGTPVEELGADTETVPDIEAIAAAEQEAAEVRQRIEGLGPVNAAAMEEFLEAQQRQEFLSVQRQDLIDSIRDTEKAIQEIDTGVAPEIRRSVRSHQCQLPRGLPVAVRRRHRRNAAHRPGEPGRIGHRYRLLASRQAAAKRAAAFGRRKGPGRGGAADGHFQIPAQPVLRDGRSGRAARRSQHHAPDASC